MHNGCQSQWQMLQVSYRGMPIYVNNQTGEMAYEADGTQLVELPSAVVDQIMEVRELDFYLQVAKEATPADWALLVREAN